MPGLYVKNEDGEWVLTNHQYVKYASTGWRRAMEVFQKTGASTWTQMLNYDSTPPASPILTNSTVTSSMQLVTSVQLPSDADVVGGVLKTSVTGWPTNPESTATSTGYIPNLQADGNEYSVLIGDPDDLITRKLTATSGRTYYIRAWAKDSNNNYSTTPASASLTFPYPPTPAPTLVTKTADVTTVASGSWNRVSRYWRTDNNYVYQGAPYHWDGRWFYGGKIKTLLSKAVTINYVKIYIKRHTSAHGVSGKANIKVGTHPNTTKPSGAPTALNNIYNPVDLYRGEGAWVTLPTTWHKYFQNGTFAGLGTYAGITTVTSADYAYMYGNGTDSGKLRISWTEYA